MRDQLQALNAGVHMVVATPGRLNDMLTKKKFSLRLCRYLCLDEADRMIGEANFEEEVRNVMQFFETQRQTLQGAHLLLESHPMQGSPALKAFKEWAVKTARGPILTRLLKLLAFDPPKHRSNFENRRR